MGDLSTGACGAGGWSVKLEAAAVVGSCPAGRRAGLAPRPLPFPQAASGPGAGLSVPGGGGGGVGGRRCGNRRTRPRLPTPVRLACPSVGVPCVLRATVGRTHRPPNYPHTLRARAAPCQVRAAAIPPRRGGDRFTAP